MSSPSEKAADRQRRAKIRQQRRNQRTLIDGRLVAPLPTEFHGKTGTYNNHACRCQPCTDANRQRQRDAREREKRVWQLKRERLRQLRNG